MSGVIVVGSRVSGVMVSDVMVSGVMISGSCDCVSGCGVSKDSGFCGASSAGVDFCLLRESNRVVRSRTLYSRTASSQTVFPFLRALSRRLA